MLVGFSLYNYIYLLFQSLSQTNFEKHLTIYENENITVFQNFDFLTIYYHSYGNYDINFLIKVVSCFVLFAILYMNKRKNNKLQALVKNKDENITNLSIQNEKLLNKIELLEENYDVIKNLLFEYDLHINSDGIDDIFNNSKINNQEENVDDVEDEDEDVEDEDVEDEDYEYEEDSDEDDEDIYEKYEKLSKENKKLKDDLKDCNDKINKIYDYTNLDYCRSAKIVGYIRNELKKR